MALVTADDIIAYVGVKTPSQAETDWAVACAAAVEAGIAARLNGAIIVEPNAELHLAAVMAGGEAFKRREVPFGSTGFSDTEEAVALTRDYLAAVAPQIDRNGNGPGIG